MGCGNYGLTRSFGRGRLCATGRLGKLENIAAHQTVLIGLLLISGSVLLAGWEEGDSMKLVVDNSLMWEDECNHERDMALNSCGY